MKYSNLALAAACSFLLISCSNDDNMNEEAQLTGTGDVAITFDNGIGGNDLVLGSVNPANANGEKVAVTRFSYIVSNFKLLNKSGEAYVFPKDESYFIINQETEADGIKLSEIPAGEYTTLVFGVGVDQEKYLQGAEGQGNFLTLAEENNMTWSWQAGYKFLNFEGNFTSETVTEPTDFKIHMGSHGSSLDNYREVTLQLPSNILVSDGIDPNIHLKIDAGKILAGATTPIALSEKSVIMVDAEKSPQIAVNVTDMFAVDHVHNANAHD